MAVDRREDGAGGAEVSLRCVVEILWGGLKAQALSMNLVEVLLTAVLAVVLFFVGQWLMKRADKNLAKKIWQKQKEELVPLFGREMIKVLEAAGLSKKQIDSPVVQEAIQASASSIIDTWEGPLAGSVIFYSPSSGGTYTAGLVPGITEETKEQKKRTGRKTSQRRKRG